APSQVFEGLTRGASLWRPSVRPTYKAAVSPAQLTSRAIISQWGLISCNATAQRHAPKIYTTPSRAVAAPVIDFAKSAWRSSNDINTTPTMTRIIHAGSGENKNASPPAIPTHPHLATPWAAAILSNSWKAIDPTSAIRTSKAH